MFLLRPVFPLAVEHSQGIDDARTRFFWIDDAIDVAVFRRFVRCQEFLDVFLLFGFFIGIAFENDISRPIGS